MQNTWVYKKINYKQADGPFGMPSFEPDDELLQTALQEIVDSADRDGWTITALTYLPHEMPGGMGGFFSCGVTLVATFSRP